jgi:hypothetical protein
VKWQEIADASEGEPLEGYLRHRSWVLRQGRQSPGQRTADATWDCSQCSQWGEDQTQAECKEGKLMRHLFGAIVVIWIITMLFLLGAVVPMLVSFLDRLQP